MIWNSEQTERLLVLNQKGLSASKIGAELGVTRNAAIGKLHRLGLGRRKLAEDESAVAKFRLLERKPQRGQSVQEWKSSIEAAFGDVVAKDADPNGSLKSPSPQGNGSGSAEATAGKNDGLEEESIEALDDADIDDEAALEDRVDGNSLEAYRQTAKEVEEKALRLSLMELTSRTCKWPVGDPATEDFWFCGLPSQPGKPYCAAHNNLACQPIASRRDRKPLVRSATRPPQP